MTNKSELNTIVDGLLNGKKPAESYWSGDASERLAAALSARIDAGVAPSLCAHAMCGSAAAGNVAVVRMLSSRPMSTFNKAYTFGEPLRRACRAFAKATDPARQKALAECAKLLVAANGSLEQPDKYLKSGLSAAGSLEACGTTEALALLSELNEIRKRSKSTAAAKTKVSVKTEVKVEVKNELHATIQSSKIGKKRKLEPMEVPEVDEIDSRKKGKKNSNGKKV